MFTLPYRYAIIVALALGAFAITIFCQVYKYFNIAVHWYHALFTMLLITAGCWEVNRLLERLFLQPKLPASKRLLTLFLFYCAGGFLSFVWSAALVVGIGKGFYQMTWAELYNPVKLNAIYAALINLGFHLINALFYYFQEHRRQWRELEELRRITDQAHMQLMRDQIKPHFLFNNLNVLSAMVIKENPAANMFIEEFAKVYRYILNTSDQEIVLLGKEMEFVNPYIFLLKKRFDEGVHFKLDVPSSFLSFHIVPTALQMLIENAIKHNIASPARPLHINVSVQGDDHLVISNNLQQRSSVEQSTLVGLENIRKRYAFITEKPLRVNKTDSIFEVAIPLLRTC